MSYKIIVTDKFSKKIKQLKKKYRKIKEDFETLIETLTKDPYSGTNLGKNLYKLRLKSSDISKGKSGGFRVIYYLLTEDKKLYLLTIYSKSDIETINIDRILKIIEDLEL